MKKRGFTLIELLGVIVILAIIATITVPMIVTLLKGARKSVFKASAEEILKTSKMYYSKNVTDSGVIIEIANKQIKKMEYIDGSFSNQDIPSFELKGKMPDRGKITIDEDGNIEFRLDNGEFCAAKSKGNEDINILEGDACDHEIKVPTIAGVVTSKDKDKLVVVSSCYYEDDNHVKTGDANVSRYGFKIDDKDWIYTTENYYMFSKLKNGSSHKIQVSCTNELGIKVEKNLGNQMVGDIDSATITAPSGWAKSKTVTITYPSGRYTYQYSFDLGTTWISDNINNHVFKKTFSSEADNGKIIMARVLDNTGNLKEAVSLKIAGIDTHAPTCGTITGAGTTSTWTKNNRTVSVGCSDTGGSTCSQTTFSNKFSSNATTSNITISDKAGNTTSCPVGVYIDKNPPTCTTSGGQNTWKNSNMTITGNCSDTGGSGCSNITKTITENDTSVALLSYEGHSEDFGWLGVVRNGDTAGTTGQGKRLEALSMNVSIPGLSCSISYEAHVSDVGWQAAVSNGTIAGTTGQSKAIEAVKISLSGACTGYFNVKYRAHVAEDGWQSWVTNGAVAGTTGQSKRMEALEAYLEPKSGSGYQLIGKTPVKLVSPGTVTDGAGNATACPTNVVAAVDTTKPPALKLINTSGGSIACDLVGVSTTTADEKSGIATYKISYSGTSGAWGNVSTTTAWENKMNETVSFKACDQAGNCSDTATTTVHIGTYGASNACGTSSSTTCTSVTACGCKTYKKCCTSYSATKYKEDTASGCYLNGKVVDFTQKTGKKNCGNLGHPINNDSPSGLGCCAYKTCLRSSNNSSCGCAVANTCTSQVCTTATDVNECCHD